MMAPRRIWFFAIDQYFAAGRRIALRETFDVVEQAALARARRADDTDNLAWPQGQIEFFLAAAFVPAAKNAQRRDRRFDKRRGGS